MGILISLGDASADNIVENVPELIRKYILMDFKKMKMRNRMILISSFPAIIIYFLFVFILVWKSNSAGEIITISRKTPSGEDILRLVDDASSREFFSNLNLQGAKDLGGQDSAITSTWCGIFAKNINKLFEIGAFNKVEQDSFVRMPSPILETFDLYGVRSLGYRDIGIAAKNDTDCVNLYVINTF